MPFEPDDNLPQNPAVRILFSGLMVIDPNANGGCEVFVHRSAPAHTLTIEVRRKTANRPDGIMMRHVGPLAFVGPEDDPQNPPIHGLMIQKQGNKAIKKYTGDPRPGGEERLSLAIDLVDPRFHNGNPEVTPDLVTQQPRHLLDIDPLGSRPSIFMDDGIFYTAAKTREDLILTLKQENKPDRVLDPFASLIGANIHLDQGESVGLLWRNQGKLETLNLEKPAEGESYEIYIVNDPLFENDSITNPALNPKHDEFREYYKILPAVPTTEQFRLECTFPEGGVPVDRGSTMVPCMPIVKGGG